MYFDRHEKILILFNLAYIIPFTMYYISIRNFEFLWYIVVLVGFFALILFTIRKSQFSPAILWGLSLWGFMHMAGGGVRVAGDVLYALPLLPLFEVGDTMVLKYDQFVHVFGFAVATLVVFHLLKRYLIPEVNPWVILPIVVAAGMGLGALNEIVEFSAVVSMSDTGVGGYYNTAIDLVANTIGAIFAAVYIFVKNFKKNN